MLALLWVFPSLGATWILATGCRAWFQASSLFNGLASVKVEEWVALALLAAQAVFCWRALRPDREREVR